MKHNRVPQGGFSLIELVTVLLLTAVLAAVAAPMFINLGSDAAQARGSDLFVNVKSGILQYANQCRIRGSDKMEDSTGLPVYPASDICMPANRRQNGSHRGNIGIANIEDCYAVFNGVLAEGTVEPVNDWSSVAGNSNKPTISASQFITAQDNDRPLYLHQERNAGGGYCHFYYLDGTDLTALPYFYYNANTGNILIGIIDTSNGVTFGDEKQKTL